MSLDQSLKEHVVHGTPRRPLRAMHFTAGPGTAYPDHFFVEQHWHDYIEILLIRKGEYLIEINLEAQTLREGDLCILNSGDLHQPTGLGPDAVHDAILFDPQILNFSYLDEWEETCIAPFLEHALVIRNILHPADCGYPGLWSLSSRFVRHAQEQKEGWYTRCKLLLLHWFDLLGTHRLFSPANETLSESGARRIRRYKALISYLEAHYQEPVSLKQLSEVIHCNSQYLCRSFREIAGVSPIQYLISYRIERACTLLTCTARPVTDIALSCGFENISYFIRTFRARKGCTPREYRMRHS